MYQAPPKIEYKWNVDTRGMMTAEAWMKTPRRPSQWDDYQQRNMENNDWGPRDPVLPPPALPSVLPLSAPTDVALQSFMDRYMWRAPIPLITSAEAAAATFHADPGARVRHVPYVPPPGEDPATPMVVKVDYVTADELQMAAMAVVPKAPKGKVRKDMITKNVYDHIELNRRARHKDVAAIAELLKDRIWNDMNIASSDVVRADHSEMECVPHACDLLADAKLVDALHDEGILVEWATEPSGWQGWKFSLIE